MAIENQQPAAAPGEQVPAAATTGNTAAPGDITGPAPDAVATTIRIRDAAGAELAFKLKTTTKLSKAMDRFAEHVGRSRAVLRFLFDGERVQDHHTTHDLGMEDEAVIDAHTEQLGGGA